jgi:formate hydrogenlyase subunit 6/NADH:ubiquinone oxidoreductase subunit I
MLGWILQGLRTGIVTTRYPREPEPQPDGMRNRLIVDASRCHPASHGECAAACPTSAVTADAVQLRLDLARCIQCGRCVAVCPTGALSFTGEYEVAVLDRKDLITEIQR